MIRPAKVWACVAPAGWVLIQTVSYLRREALAKFLEGSPPTHGWDYYRRKGWTVQKVQINARPQPSTAPVGPRSRGV